MRNFLIALYFFNCVCAFSGEDETINKSALNSAIESGNTTEVMRLLSTGSNPDELFIYGGTGPNDSERVTGPILAIAVLAKNIDLVKTLLKYGANPNILYQTDTISATGRTVEESLSIKSLVELPTSTEIKNLLLNEGGLRHEEIQLLNQKIINAAIYKSTVNGLRIRNKPNTVSNIIGTLILNEEIYQTEVLQNDTINNLSGSWVKIITKKLREGYVFNGYLTPKVIDIRESQFSIELGTSYPFEEILSSTGQHMTSGFELKDSKLTVEYISKSSLRGILFYANGKADNIPSSGFENNIKVFIAANFDQNVEHIQKTIGDTTFVLPKIIRVIFETHEFLKGNYDKDFRIVTSYKIGD